MIELGSNRNKTIAGRSVVINPQLLENTRNQIQDYPVERMMKMNVGSKK